MNFKKKLILLWKKLNLPIKQTKYVLIYPDTIIPPVVEEEAKEETEEEEEINEESTETSSTL